MSKLSDIFKGFESSLRVGQQRNEELYLQHQVVVDELYKLQLKELIKSWKKDFESTVKLTKIHAQIRCFFLDVMTLVLLQLMELVEQRRQQNFYYSMLGLMELEDP